MRNATDEFFELAEVCELVRELDTSLSTSGQIPLPSHGGVE